MSKKESDKEKFTTKISNAVIKAAKDRYGERKTGRVIEKLLKKDLNIL